MCVCMYPIMVYDYIYVYTRLYGYFLALQWQIHLQCTEKASPKRTQAQLGHATCAKNVRINFTKNETKRKKRRKPTAEVRNRSDL